MTAKRRRTAWAMGVLLCGVAFPAAAQKQEKYTARLAPVAMDVAMKANIAGEGSATATLDGRKLTVTGSFEGLKTNATMAQLRRGSMMGVRGPAVLDLSVTKATSGQISGSFELTQEQADALQKGKLYIQIHSEKAPDGNLWGWFQRQETK
jgi:hypothetical protein